MMMDASKHISEKSKRRDPSASKVSAYFPFSLSYKLIYNQIFHVVRAIMPYTHDKEIVRYLFYFLICINSNLFLSIISYL